MGINKRSARSSENKTSNSKANKCKKGHAFSAVFATGDYDKSDWYIDSGASAHLTAHYGWLQNRSSVQAGEIKIADNTSLSIECGGSIDLQTKAGSRIVDVRIQSVLYVPHLTTNLLSVGELVRNGDF